ncbi:MAG: hypothetical protein HAW61_03070 [Candidatus Portiera sp.]|nr:hypothetical protein [Portiera sp.]
MITKKTSMNSRNKTSTTTAAALKIQNFDSIVWIFNILFLTICFGAISRQLSLNVFIGILLGVALSLGLYYLRYKQGPAVFFKYSLRVNMLGLFLGILTAAFFLWNNLLNGRQLAIAEHTVILFFLLGLSSTAALLKMIALKYVTAPSIEERVKQMMGGPSLTFSFCVATILACLLMLLLYTIDTDNYLVFLKTKFLERGLIPPLCLVLFFWGSILLLGKYLLVMNNFRIANKSSTVALVELWNDYKDSMGSPKDKGVTQKFVELMWQANETFYLFPRYINWAMPILGFIGTVLGISLAAGEIGRVVGSSSLGIGDSINAALQPLGIAFDTTLVALSLSILLALGHTLLQRWEEQMFLFVEEFIEKLK